MAIDINDFNKIRSQEWLETNGLGGYASGTVLGAHTRRYHGLLVAAMNPPIGRTVVLSKLDETIVIGGQRYELGTNQYPGTFHPRGFEFLQHFDRDLFPEFIYKAGAVQLKRTIAAIQDENSTVVLYEVLNSPEKFTLELLPLCSARDYHSASQANESLYKGYVFNDGVFQTKNYFDSPELFIQVPGSAFRPTGNWYHRFEYAVEQYRGLDFREDLFNHGVFEVDLKAGDKLAIVISTENPKGKDGAKLFNKELKRRQAITKPYGWNDHIRRLVLAADQFVVKRGNDLKTVIAGYHWFSDWGRDTMISLPGLCLITGRFSDAKKILKAFAASVSDGMLPNRFPDQGEVPEYNTADATLWFFHAVHQYYRYTSDIAFVKTLLPVLKDIVRWHEKGTRYNIHEDDDGLLFSGQAGVQLTWMDAKVGEWVVTPRTGKAVEINALWYHTLLSLSELLIASDFAEDAKVYSKKAETIRAAFESVFWNEEKECLYDFVQGDYKNDDVRPNQLYAISLTSNLLHEKKAKKVLKMVKERLVTPRGLRSLSPEHPEYKPTYGGDQWHRDGAYHQGTVWSYLIGPYVDALIKLRGTKGRAEAVQLLMDFLGHLQEAGIGTISEIFDAEPPYNPRGCIAQAWGVAEVLRVVVEYDLFVKPSKAIRIAEPCETIL